MKIAFVWDWEPSWEQAYQWRDGLAAALKLLGERHELGVFTDTDKTIPHPFFPIQPIDGVAAFNPDVILHWADMTRPHAVEHAKLGKPMAICFAGGELFNYNNDLFDHVFVESKSYLDRLLEKGVSASLAFGTNTDLFRPIKQAKIFDALFPATFATWKRHELFAEATKDLKAAAVGYMYDDHEQECWQTCVDQGALVLPHVSADALVRLYNASKVCLVTSRSDGGSQRTVLEAAACNIPVIIMSDSDKAQGYQVAISVDPNPETIRQAMHEWINPTGLVEVMTRNHVLANWSHVSYANALEEGLLGLVS